MSLVESLKEIQAKAVDEKVIAFTEKVEGLVTGSAAKGYSGFRYQIQNEDPNKHIMCSKTFIEKLQMLMDGVKVDYKKEEKKMLITGFTYYEHYIHFQWND
ncbi:hypothetical protein [Bacillus wiedmannii]|uniref:hypothetical protein n=1 Tax=Bacillus wiedmannii TaxID=1890302 RepID=UPI000CD8C36C|nr:hypothetical protein [Bacillus wiedmannii]MBG9830541.1 hypothetical protein [Bacillus wiedmannii]MED3076378.1 hypothetical protein [Bacillus wiedmannii]UOB93870.1 hypothetical protein BTI679_11870 [Bacillus wiedmannii]